MDNYREQVVTTTTTAAPPSVPVQPIIVNTPVVSETARVEQVTLDPYASRRVILYRMQQAMGIILVFVEGLIAIRFILRLLGANASAGFAQLIYGITAPLVAPFVGLFGTPRFDGSVFEFTSLVAMVVYALVAWLIIRVVFMFFGETRTGLVTQRTETRIR
ncbi:MAG: YggT family protein [Anaerolineae bacterium]